MVDDALPSESAVDDALPSESGVDDALPSESAVDDALLFIEWLIQLHLASTLSHTIDVVTRQLIFAR